MTAQSTTDTLVTYNHQTTAAEAGKRVDMLLAQQLPQYSREQIKGWILDGSVLVDGIAIKPKYRVKSEQQLNLTAQIMPHGQDLPEDIALDICYEDDSLLVVNKPVGLVVHPGAGNPTGTLVNGLLYHYPELETLPRAGLVHRIDKDTSGLLMVAKSKAAQLHLTDQLKDKSLFRQYQAVTVGIPTLQRVDAAIGRHPVQRIKMSIQSSGKDAVTDITAVKPLASGYAVVTLELQTGRTHQIRVHLTHIGHPIVGDPTYGQGTQILAGLNPQQRQCVQSFNRQALHAYQLGFIHPVKEELVTVECPLPEDMQGLIQQLDET